MAKVAFTKLGLKLNNQIKTLEFNGQTIEIKQYISIEDKLQIITDTMNMSIDGLNGFINPIKTKVYMKIGIIEYYTNISFTEKQKQNIVKLYDLVVENGLYDLVFNNIPTQEYQEIEKGLYDSVVAYDRYKQSVLGMFDALSTQYNETSFDLEKIQEKLTNPQALATLKELIGVSGYMDIEEEE